MASAKAFLQRSVTFLSDTWTKWTLETITVLLMIVVFVVSLAMDTECSDKCREECQHKDSQTLTVAAITLAVTSGVMLVSFLKNVFIDRAAVKRAKESADAIEELKRTIDEIRLSNAVTASAMEMAIADAGLNGVHAPAHLNDGLNGTSFHALYHTRNRPPRHPLNIEVTGAGTNRAVGSAPRKSPANGG